MSHHHQNIVIPYIHHPSTFQRMHPQEDVRTDSEHKFYITPNRETRPLGLVTKNVQGEGQGKKVQPSFDHFDLSAMFSNKILTEGQLMQFHKSKQGPSQKFETPTRKKGDNIALKQTEQPRQGNSEAKKSRPKEKGLRQLSQRAYEIVLNLRSASYKEVANKLVDELNSQKDSDHQILRSRIEQKDEQNIKRRVYDALNVLIALGVLRKDGRKIVGDRSIKEKYGQTHRNALAAQIQAKKQKVRCKRQQLRKQQAKLQFFPALIEQNQRDAGQCNKIDFPFMILGVQPSSVVRTQLQDGGCLKIEVRKQKSHLMKMDLDCYTQYKLSQSQA